MCYYDCPEGMEDVGVSCHKDNYSRGTGKPLKCTNEQEYDAGLCYEPCMYGADGTGSVCYGHCPPATQQCGLDSCMSATQSCTAMVGDLKTSLEVITVQLMLHGYHEEINIADGSYTHKYPRCDGYYDPTQ